MQTWKLLDTGGNIGAYNMAVDEELLAKAQTSGTMPVLRLYSWTPPAVSIGRFQDIKTAVNNDACKRHGFDIVRRVTGGRAVLHRNELTYSIVARSDDPLFPKDVLGTYKVIAGGLVAGLRNLGLPAQMAARGSGHETLVEKQPKNAACFSSPSWYEILVNKKKIIGSAQRRGSGAFLQHGSILIDYDPDLEAEVIPGGGRVGAISCIKNELQHPVSIEDIKKAVVSGFAQALHIAFL